MKPFCYFLSSLFLLITLLAIGCTGTAIIGPDPGADDDDITPPGDDDDITPQDDDDDNDDDDNDDDDNDDDEASFDGVEGFFVVYGGIRHPGPQGTGAWGYFQRGGGDDRASPSPQAPAPRQLNGARGPDFGCSVSVPEDDSDWGQTDSKWLDAGEVVTFRRGPRVWELERQVSDGISWYAVEPEHSPEGFPGANSLRFTAPGGADVPAFEIPSAMPIVREFSVTRPGLVTGSDTLVLDPSYAFQFAWTPMGDAGVEVLIEFVDEHSGATWQVDCWVEDNGSFAIETTDLSAMPTGRLGQAAIRRYDTNWIPPGDDSPEMTFTGAYEHSWNLLFESTTRSGHDAGVPPG